MDNQWRTDEPEQGQLAQIIDEQGETHLALGHNGNGLNEFGWETDSGWLDFHQVLKWLPLRTPEENRLRDLLRWRKWPEEKPNESGWFLCNFGRTDDCEDIVAVHFDLEGDRFDWSYEINPKWWRPIGPLPCERGG